MDTVFFSFKKGDQQGKITCILLLGTNKLPVQWLSIHRAALIENLLKRAHFFVVVVGM